MPIDSVCDVIAPHAELTAAIVGSALSVPDTVFSSLGFY